MSGLIPKFLSNLEQLELNQIPQTNSGKPYKKLKYKGEKYEKLTDDDVKKLCDALENNNTFHGELNLSKNDLTCLSGLYIANAMKKFRGIEKLILAKNNFKSKAGEFIGDALIENPDYPIKELDFKDNKLEEYGLRRVIVAATKNHNLKKLNLGIITDFGLELLGQELGDTGLEKIEFEEDDDNPFSDSVKNKFIELTEEFPTLVKCKDKTIKYYSKEKKKELKENCKHKKNSLDNDPIFSFLSKLSVAWKEKKGPHKIAIQKYFKNTFGDLLNDAMYELTRKQEKFPDNDEFFTVEGSCSFVGEFLLENLPEHEVESLRESKDKKTDKVDTES